MNFQVSGSSASFRLGAWPAVSPISVMVFWHPDRRVLCSAVSVTFFNRILGGRLVDVPDRPIARLLVPLRSVVRAMRRSAHRISLRGKMSCGTNVNFGRDCTLLPPDFVRLGNNIGIGTGFHLEANLDVGDDVLISSHVSIVGNDHQYNDPQRSIFFGGRLPPSTVTIEGDNLIGHRVIVVGNVRIGRGCIVGAGSVVTRDLPENAICYGVPAIPRRARFSVTLGDDAVS